MATKSPQSNSSFLNDPRLKTIGFHAFVWSLTLIVLFPIIWMVVTSLNVTTSRS
ncbi:hypothetical protein [Haladaptatus sp. R4]|uniref:hypothetical protein n=1 Tax=Haladaptatus sp. R4 TaxID=1679489 RepID=UPI000AAD6FFA|nr:hypothetical protein [Haladaptatus sp. R4]